MPFPPSLPALRTYRLEIRDVALTDVIEELISRGYFHQGRWSSPGNWFKRFDDIFEVGFLSGLHVLRHAGFALSLLQLDHFEADGFLSARLLGCWRPHVLLPFAQ